MNFHTAFTSELISNIHNPNFPLLDSYSAKNKITNAFKNLLKTTGFYKIDYSISEILESLKQFDPYMVGLSEFYEHLETEADKELFIQLMIFRILKWKIQLPLNTAAYFELNEKAKGLLVGKESITTKAGTKLYKVDLSPAFPLTLYQNLSGVLDIFYAEQYKYVKDGITIGVQKDDYVIDAGGCYGETALYFSNLAGEKGKVFSFEFIPSNLELFQKNLELNPSFKNRVTVQRNPLWEYSNKKLCYKDWGAGSVLSEEKNIDSDGEIVTISIDDFVQQNAVPKINFIKMDIEGAEFNSLKGAEKTIAKFHPTLAIALYHSIEDFARIPKLIKSIYPGYKFYLGHSTPYIHETILFAMARG